MVRFKNRYFLCEIQPNEGSASVNPLDLQESDLFYAVMQATEQMHGEFGAAAIRSGINVKYCNKYTRITMIRVRHGPHRLVGSSLPFITKVGNQAVTFHGIYTGATIVKCFAFLKKYQKAKLEELLQHCKNDKFRKIIVDNIDAINKVTG